MVDSIAPRGRVIDLFSGMGAVACSLAPSYPILTNDTLTFTGAFARARFTDQNRTAIPDVLRRIRPLYRSQVLFLTDENRTRIARELRAMEDGWRSLRDYIATAAHVGTSRSLRTLANQRRNAATRDRYSLATLYFSGGYFSTVQAISLDAIRRAIDECPLSDRDWLLSAWLSAAATVVNAPGHTAQFLRPRNAPTGKRICRQWQRNVWSIFVDRVSDLSPVGTASWRKRNEATTLEAIELLRGRPKNIGLVYADPPYTKDHYSRYYHVYETLYLYDFPNSTGEGRYRQNRFLTPFSIRSVVAETFRTLFEAVASAGVPFVLSYPDKGLLELAGTRVSSLLKDYFSSVRVETFALDHSTLGASKGSVTKAAMENLYVCA